MLLNILLVYWKLGVFTWIVVLQLLINIIYQDTNTNIGSNMKIIVLWIITRTRRMIHFHSQLFIFVQFFFFCQNTFLGVPNILLLLSKIKNKDEHSIFSLQDVIAKKWRHKVLFLRKKCGRQFSTIVNDSISISSAHTHVPSMVQ